MSKSVTSASGDTKAIAGTKDDGQWRRRGPGTRPWVQLSPPGPGSAWLRTAERSREEERESNDKGGSHRPAPAATPKLKRNKAPTRRPCQAGRRRGRAAQGDPPGQGYLKEGLGARHRRPPRPGRAAGRTVLPGVLRGGRSLPAARRRRRPRPGPGSREAARWPPEKLAKGRGPLSA